MSILEEARRSTAGAVRVIRFEPGALQAFDLTVEGCWRSFRAALLLLPLYFIYLLAFPRPEGVGAGRFWLIEAIHYPLSWTLWPLIAFHICRSAGVAGRYTTYLTVYNWAQILLSGGQMALILLVFGLWPQALPGVVALTWIAVQVAEARIVRFTLGVSWPQAVLIQALTFVTALLLGFFKQFVMLGGG